MLGNDELGLQLNNNLSLIRRRVECEEFVSPLDFALERGAAHIATSDVDGQFDCEVGRASWSQLDWQRDCGDQSAFPQPTWSDRDQVLLARQMRHRYLGS